MIDFCAIDAQTDAGLAAALKNFEAEFRYPLGRDRWFTISHGEDYTRFFRAIGEARCFIACRDARVIGVISVSHCRMRRTDGEWLTAAYISDLKVSATGGGRCLLRLLRNAAAWARGAAHADDCGILGDHGRYGAATDRLHRSAGHSRLHGTWQTDGAANAQRPVESSQQ